MIKWQLNTDISLYVWNFVFIFLYECKINKHFMLSFSNKIWKHYFIFDINSFYLYSLQSFAHLWWFHLCWAFMWNQSLKPKILVFLVYLKDTLKCIFFPNMNYAVFLFLWVFKTWLSKNIKWGRKDIVSNLRKISILKAYVLLHNT